MKSHLLFSILLLAIQPTLQAQPTPVLVKDIIPSGGQYGPYGSNPFDFTSIGNRIYFRIKETGSSNFPKTGLWTTDGTPAGTIAVDETTTYYPTTTSVTAYNLKGYFVKLLPNEQVGLFRVSDSNPTPQLVVSWTGTSNVLYPPAVLKNKLYFIREGAIWETDGTAAGTERYYPSSSGNSKVTRLISDGKRLFFTTWSSFFIDPMKYWEGESLYSISKSNGDTGALLVPSVSYKILQHHHFRDEKSAWLFRTDSTVFVNMVTSQGYLMSYSTASTYTPGYPIITFSQGYGSGSPGYYTPLIFNEKLYILEKEMVYGQSITYYNVLLKIDSSGAKTPIKTFRNLQNGAGETLLRFKNWMFFAANDSSGNGQELWRSDGTTHGTILLKDINPGAGSSNIRQFATTTTDLYFTAFDGQNWGIWKTDGTAAGTVKFANFPTSNPTVDPFGKLFFYRNTLFFAANDGTTGMELWKIDIPILPPPMLPGCAVNLLQNPGFEGGFSNWEGQGGDLSAPPETPSGSKALKFCNPEETRRQTVAASAGKKYRLTAIAKSDGTAAEVQFKLKFLSGDWQVLSEQTVETAVQPDFSTHFLEKTAPPQTAWLEISVTKKSVGCVVLDDFMLCE